MILETKLQPPSLKPNTLRRVRLLKLIKNSLERKLVLVTGDAGYGKTTLLAQLIQEAHLPCVFYDLEKGDSDLVVFCSYLVHGLDTFQPGLPSRTKGLLEQGGEVGKNYELLSGTLINELVEKRKEELFFILDDYHALPDDSLVHKALDYFIDHLPDIVHVVISSRTIPPLPSLAKWRAKEDLFELTREGLRFTEEEVKALLSEVYKLVLSEEEIKRVSEQTEGWITGIRLILQSAGKDGRTVKETLNGYLEANQPLFEYFANEILDSEVLEAQDFLRKSSILDIMTPEACDHIFGVVGSGERLKTLEKRNFFLSEVGEGQYKYHRLFREFLESRIKDERFKTALHLKAADYFQRKEQFEQTIEHYLEAGSYEWAGKVILQVADTMREQARFDTLDGWLQRIPLKVLERQPQLLVVQGELCREKGDIQEAEEKYIQAEPLLKEKGEATGLADVLLEHSDLLWVKGRQEEALKLLRRALTACSRSEEKLRGNILIMIGNCKHELGDFRKARTYLLRAKKAIEPLKNATSLNAVESNLAVLLNDQGEVRLAYDLFKPLSERIKKFNVNVGIAISNAARTAIDLGQTEWAEQCLGQGWALCRPYQHPLSQLVLHLAFGALYTQKEEWDQARQHLEQARDGAAKLGWTRMEFATLRDLSRLCRYRGEFENAQNYLGLAREKIGKGENPLEANFLAELGILEASRSEPEKARQTIKRCLSLTRRFGLKREEFLALLAHAEVCRGKGTEKEALRWFRQAVHLAKLKGYHGILMRELRHGPPLADLAGEVARRKGPLADYLKKVFSGSEQRESNSAKPIPQKRAPSLEAQLFGTFQLSLSNGKVIPLKWPTRKETSLFSFLLLHRNRVCNREELIGALWPATELTKAEKNLRSSIFRLKKTLTSGFQLAKERTLMRAPIIVHQERGYRIASTLSFRLDVEEFQEEWQRGKSLKREGDAEGRQKSYQRCVDLYRDSFLSNLGERWCEEHREQLEKQYLSALKELAAQRWEKKDYEEAIALHRLYLTKAPYSEEVRRELWKALKAAGRKGDIQKDYKDLRRILKKDFGEEPQAETEEVYRELMLS